MEVVTIIPAYNEEKTIGDVLKCLVEVEEIKKIIVVSDGSTDNTVEVARSFNVEVVELEANLGKGGAMKAGFEKFTADVVLFLDADLIGLTSEHVRNLLSPVLNNEAEMTIGIFDKGRVATDWAQRMAPGLSGQRAVKSSVLKNISDIDISRFGVEVALTRHAEENNVIVIEVPLKDMTHVMKEEKLGVWKGVAARVKMYWEIVKYFTTAESLKK